MNIPIYDAFLCGGGLMVVFGSILLVFCVYEIISRLLKRGKVRKTTET